jgi:ABC-type lipoprotein export system ATPase subunit
MSTPAVRCERLFHVYSSAGQETTALRGVDLEVLEGDTVGLLGPSGSGKSTLLWILAGLTRPTAGTVEMFGRSLAGLGARQAGLLRVFDVGIVLQTPGRNLLAHETATGNMAFAQRASRGPAALRRRRAGELLELVGLGPVAHRRAGALSGGEQQRLAVAAALANGPRLVLADEPTSQLDHSSARQVLEALQAANRELGTTILTVTHDGAVGAAMDRTVTIRDGRVGLEGRSGQEYLVVGRDGTVQLPEPYLDLFPPGSLASAQRTPHGVELRPVEPGEPG